MLSHVNATPSAHVLYERMEDLLAPSCFVSGLGSSTGLLLLLCALSDSLIFLFILKMTRATSASSGGKLSGRILNRASTLTASTTTGTRITMLTMEAIDVNAVTIRTGCSRSFIAQLPVIAVRTLVHWTPMKVPKTAQKTPGLSSSTQMTTINRAVSNLLVGYHCKSNAAS